MLRLVTSRMAGALAAIFGASIVSFLLLRVLPGDPARLIAGPLASEEALARTAEQLGLNDPMLVQYWRFISTFFRGDWGFSYAAGEPVVDQMRARLPASLELGFYAFLFAFMTAVLLALVATYRRRRTVDGAVRSLSFLGLGTPPFWFGLIVLLIFFEALVLLPGPGTRLSITPPPTYVTGFLTIDSLLAGRPDQFFDALWHLVLPAITLGLAPFAFLVRLLRANLLEVSREPFITVVRSKGIGSWRTYSRHALPNAFLPTITAGGLILAQLLGGSVLVEKVFDWPGIGALVVNSILRQDFAVVQVFVLLSAILYVFVNLIVDILYGVIDPRVRAAGRAA